MSALRLSKTQRELLDAMRGGVVVHYMRYMGRFNPHPYYFRTDGGRCTKAAQALLEKGLVEKVEKTQFGDHKLIATPLNP
jgi:hypothetical protein